MVLFTKTHTHIAGEPTMVITLYFLYHDIFVSCMNYKLYALINAYKNAIKKHLRQFFTISAIIFGACMTILSRICFLVI